MSTKLNRPPATVTAAEFFETWLPSEYKRVRESGALSATPPDNKIAISLTGDGGGEWTLTMASGDLSADAGALANAPISLSADVADFRALVVGEQGDHQLIPADAGIDLNLLVADKQTQEILDSSTGKLTFVVSGFNGRDWSLAVALKGAEQPAATISVPADVYQQILNGEIAAPQAYFSGQIKVDGDIAFAMQLGMALMQRQQQ